MYKVKIPLFFGEWKDWRQDLTCYVNDGGGKKD